MININHHDHKIIFETQAKYKAQRIGVVMNKGGRMKVPLQWSSTLYFVSGLSWKRWHLCDGHLHIVHPLRHLGVPDDTLILVSGLLDWCGRKLPGIIHLLDETIVLLPESHRGGLVRQIWESNCANKILFISHKSWNENELWGSCLIKELSATSSTNLLPAPTLRFPPCHLALGFPPPTLTFWFPPCHISNSFNCFPRYLLGPSTLILLLDTSLTGFHAFAVPWERISHPLHFVVVWMNQVWRDKVDYFVGT